MATSPHYFTYPRVREAGHLKCPVCRRPVADDAQQLEIRGLVVHIECAAYRRRAVR
jgi:hypothetical protein